MYSMTGYGKGEAEGNGYKFTVELKSVNGKFLDISTKAAKSLMQIEDKLKKEISNTLKRGNIDLVIYYQKDVSKQDTSVEVNKQLAKQVFCEAEALASELGISVSLTAKDLLRFPEVMTVVTPEEDMKKQYEVVLEALQKALSDIVKMREVEGLALQRDLKSKIDMLEKTLEKIKEKAPEVEVEYRQKLQKRITQSLEGVELDENKLINEVAFFVDRSDINEEITRLGSHIDQFNKILVEDGAVGKQLEFLSQEITREINTIGSKANNNCLTSLVLEAKNINESIKEQIRNVE